MERLVADKEANPQDDLISKVCAGHVQLGGRSFAGHVWLGSRHGGLAQGQQTGRRAASHLPNPLAPPSGR